MGWNTVRLVDPLIDPIAALIIVGPAFTLVVSPVALMVATAVADDFHLAELVRSCVLLSA